MEGETRRVEFTDPVTRAWGHEWLEGDIKTLPKWQADICIEQGWGKDPDTGEQGARVPGAKTLDVHPIHQQLTES